ncbi:MAG: bifunctional metallophosphatase/5'-nucleotidase, partial [Chlorobi bacterium]|nr:bifunctional metallophosphatase/5'-nucleotidase [Chlorobiota bacterium]
MKNKLRVVLQVSILFFAISINTYSQELTILHTNDMHSKLTGYGPESEYTPLSINDDGTIGGFARLSTLFANSKEQHKDATLILDAGDFLMGSLFHVAEEETGFQLNLMKKMGYDVITLGNHEFDFGPETLVNILSSAKKNGGYPEIVSANMQIPIKFILNTKLRLLEGRDAIRSYTVVNKNGLKIAVFGLLGIDAAHVAPLSKPINFEEPIKAAKRIVEIIKCRENPDLIICLSHSGIDHEKDKKGNIQGEDINLANEVPDIDIIISGHTHSTTEKPIVVNNTYIVQTGSYVNNLGEINLKVENGKIADFKFKLIPVDDKIQGDKQVYNEIEKQKEFINKKYLAPAKLTYNTKVAQINFDLTMDYNNLKESNLGVFVADATKYYLQENGINPDFSMVASGTIREDLLKGKNGIITVPDIFRVMSLGRGYDEVPGYPLAMIYITGREVKKLMEILSMSRAKGGNGYLYTSGLKIYTNPKKMMLHKVRKVELNGKVLDISKKNKKLYSITANTYLLSFLGEIKKMSHGLISVIPKDKNGNPITDMKNQLIDINPNKEGVQEAKEWIALIEYMKSFEKGSKNLPVIPE